MARDHAQIRLDMWGDDDWRKLSVPAQHLYMLLLTSPSLSLCGVADWRPARIAQLAAGWTTEDVLAAAAELTERLFLVIDEVTEEALIRSFVRHDGLMKMPNMATAMATAHGAIASATLRGVVVHELRRLHEKQPDLPGWRSTRALAVLERDAVDPSGNPSVNPSGNPSVKGSVGGSPMGSANPSVNPSPTPTPTPTPAPSSSDEEEKELLPRKRARRIPDDFAPSEDDRAFARERGFNDAQIDEVTGSFVRYWQAKGGRDATKLDWSKTWRNWVVKEDPRRVRGAVHQLRPAMPDGNPRHYVTPGQHTFADGTPMPWDR